MSEPLTSATPNGLLPNEVGTERWGRPVVNIDEAYLAEASPELQRLIAAETTGAVTYDEVDWTTLQVADQRLASRTVIPRLVIHHKTAKDEPGEFDGCHIGEELHGSRLNPLLLLWPTDVRAGTRPKFSS